MTQPRIDGDTVTLIFSTTKWEPEPVFHLPPYMRGDRIYFLAYCGQKILDNHPPLGLPLRHSVRFARLCEKCQHKAGILITEPIATKTGGPRMPTRDRQFADPDRPSLFDLIDTTPAHRDDPYSSRQAAAKAAPKAKTQTRLTLEAIVAAGPDGITTRDLQRRLWETPAHPAWNKVATRCLALQRAGLVRRDGTRTTTRDGDQHFLVYVATAAGREVTE